MKIKINAYVDGFNLYHSLSALGHSELKWLDLKKLIKYHLKEDESLVNVKYFTAYASWNQEKQKRHKRYVRALELSGVEVILGRFKRKYFSCDKWGFRNKTREEKRTDVNIAISILMDAVKHEYDKVIIVSGDTDLIPAIETVKEAFSDKKIGVLFPPQRHTNEMAKIADFCHTIKVKTLEECLLPLQIKLPSNKFLTPPEEWTK